MLKLITGLVVPLLFIKKLWEHWNIVGAILFSLMLQTFLTLVAPFRRSTRDRCLLVIIWCAYLIADATASFAIGLISNNVRSPCDSSGEEEDDLLAFWAPFLLLHLGCPDPITAFSLEDNELWQRHMLSLILQAVASLYVFFQSLSHNKLELPTFLMFIAGIIKYSERIWALYRASTDSFRKYLLQDKDPGPDYALLMDKFACMRDGHLPTKTITVEQPEKEDRDVKLGKLSDLEVLHYAYHFFETFKGLVVDLVFSRHARKESRDFFKERKPEDALRVIEVELNFLYGVFYTKMMIMHSLVGYVFRIIACGSILAALALFHFHTNQSKYDPFNVKITYSLLLGALALEFVSFLMLFFSDWTFASPDHRALKPLALIYRCFLALTKSSWHWVPGNKVQVLGTPLFRRWSGSVSGHNFVRYCRKSSPTTMLKFTSWWDPISKARNPIAKLVGTLKLIRLPLSFVSKLCYIPETFAEKVGIKEFLDEMAYVSHEPLAKDLWDLVFREIKEKSEEALISQHVAKRISSSRGEWVLTSSEYSHIDWTEFMSHEAELDERIILWHIATDLCYHKDLPSPSAPSSSSPSLSYQTTSKLLSDYMLYLLVMRPSIMSTLVGLAKIRFQDTLAEAERLFDRYGLEARNSDKEACDKIYYVNTDVKPVYLKGDRSKSVLFDACRLAKVLDKFEDGKWVLISKVWVELLSYAATQCRPSAHVEQIGKGGELITFVWLLVAHFGLGHCFQTTTVAKLIAGK
ncbi:hypothetical protein Goshw_014261 [Gossypium schwendimanii]|uniref:DUF4220 domain-containing protein n=1 Tax=Gossypium schwendimanii TaxID=34291 RepID=A0A7J9MWI8_GOSSC|nr:hypothetical protein [Gossypium schwendimanii]